MFQKISPELHQVSAQDWRPETASQWRTENNSLTSAAPTPAPAASPPRPSRGERGGRTSSKYQQSRDGKASTGGAECPAYEKECN